jgi:anti-sigma factor RsiW
VAADDIVCNELVEVVTDYLEGELSPAAHSRVEEHLVICGGCQAYVEQMRRTVEALRKVAAGDVGDETGRELLDVFRAWSGERTP